MGERTGIAWTDATWNPWIGCQRVSPGCEHCYAETLATTRLRLPVWGPASTTSRHVTADPNWKLPERLDRKAAREGRRIRVFVASLCDVFEDHPQIAPWRRDVFKILERCTNLDVQLLTKRPENIRAMVPRAWLDEWPAHVWIGTTVEDQRRADERIPLLLNVPARVRFLSVEPMLEAIDLGLHGTVPATISPRYTATYSMLHWAIVGSESGPGARPMAIEWAESIVQQCERAGVACFTKQMATADGRANRDPKGGDPAFWPARASGKPWPRQFPGVER